jgi:hypothetical protein
MARGSTANVGAGGGGGRSSGLNPKRRTMQLSQDYDGGSGRQ